MSETWAEQKEREQRRLDGDDQAKPPEDVSRATRDYLLTLEAERKDAERYILAWALLHLRPHLSTTGLHELSGMIDRADARLERARRELHEWRQSE